METIRNYAGPGEFVASVLGAAFLSGVPVLAQELRSPAQNCIPQVPGAPPPGVMGLGGGFTLPELYPFFPMAGTLYRDLFPSNFVDLDASAATQTWACSPLHTYDGHRGIDIPLRSFGEQVIGVPVFAALSGTVCSWRDGQPDMNTTWDGQVANYVILDHGGGFLTKYWHLKNGSVTDLGLACGQSVRAGEQIGLAASSGISTSPHLHFQTEFEATCACGSSDADGTIYEPFAGTCRPGESGWMDQQALNTAVYLGDFGVSRQSFAGWDDPFDPPRGGQVRLTDDNVYFWAKIHNLPANSNWRVRFRRPNGTIAIDSGTANFSNATFDDTYWWTPFYDIAEMHSTSGTWTILLDINGARMVDAPVVVLADGVNPFNLPPVAVSVTIEPTQACPEDVLVCRVSGPPVLDDPNYDIVRYQYVWRVNGNLVRSVTSAALSDALARDSAAAGDVVTCDVTPSDGLSSAAQVQASRTLQSECNWVDFAWGGVERGTFAQPWDTLDEGVRHTPRGGLVTIKAGTTSATSELTRELVVDAAGGTATIGE